MASVSGSILDTVIFFSLAFSAAFAFIAPQVDVAWANEVVPLLGRGAAGAALAIARACRFQRQVRDRGASLSRHSGSALGWYFQRG